MKKPKLLLVWSGAVNPINLGYLKALSQYVDLFVITPKNAKHGSVTFQFSNEKVIENIRFFPSLFIQWNGSFYLITAWALLLFKIKPDVIYWMDEPDRMATAFHLFISKCIFPKTDIVLYLLQNLNRPSYTRIYHNLAWAINRKLTNRYIAATQSAVDVAKKHGFLIPNTIIPLFADESIFKPPTKTEREKFRKHINVTANDLVLAYAGTLSPAKGIHKAVKVASEFENIRTVIATGDKWDHSIYPTPHFIFKNLKGMELLSLYQAADAVILASEETPYWKEQFGRILVEGSFSGCLALGSDSGAIPFLVGHPALLFKAGSEESLRNLLKNWTSKKLDCFQIEQQVQMKTKFSVASVSFQTIQFLFPLMKL